MGVYKTDKGWRAVINYYDWTGKRCTTSKRGFATKKEAQKYEKDFLLKYEGKNSMRFRDFADLYLDSMKPRVKESTFETKKSIIEKRILPFFGKMILSEITTKDVLQWQNLLLKEEKGKKPFSKSYLKSVHNQLSAMFNFGKKFYNLSENPAAIVGNIGNDKCGKIGFWTPEEYRRFSEEAKDDPISYYAFEILYWCGLREGEMLALTPADLDFKQRTIRVNKTFHYIKGKEIITDPKTVKSNRSVQMPDELVSELEDYMSMFYCLKPTERLFPIQKTYLYKHFNKAIERSGVKKIRIHDLRHSHISMLIHMGYSAVAIAQRVGHESITITYRYAHLFPSEKDDMCNDLNNIMEEIHE